MHFTSDFAQQIIHCKNVCAQGEFEKDELSKNARSSRRQGVLLLSKANDILRQFDIEACTAKTTIRSLAAL